MSILSNLVNSIVARMANREEGQTLVEYGLIIAIISLVIVVAGVAVADGVTSVFEEVGAALTGA